MGNPTQTQSWHDLETLAQTQGKAESSMGGIAATDNDIALDLTKSMIGAEAWAALIKLAQDQNVAQWRDKMFAGEAVNHTENRAVGHVWLRERTRPEIQHVLSKMQQFCAQIHEQGQFTDVVHIGIGGSDLGPRFVCDAIKHLPKKMNVHFVANVDGADIAEALKPLNPDTTLIVVASKTFTTQETMMNAAYAKAWLDGRDTARHMIALSTNEAAVREFGINPDNMFPFWDWVGGRFSVWSAIGMPIALAYGFEVFEAFLDGGQAMDKHFKSASFECNLPVLLALYGIWNRNFMKRPAVAVLPYAQNLSLMTNFLQQLDMESNGKSVDRDGDFITDYQTGPIVFGQAGTNGQHAFHQWLHQGTDIIPCEFITIDDTAYDAGHQRILNANAAAQAEAFDKGEVNWEDKNRHYAGGRPSITLRLSKLTPETLGQLIALYEHKIMVQGTIWNINSFDQFGVELGKKLAKQILEN